MSDLDWSQHGYCAVCYYRILSILAAPVTECASCKKSIVDKDDWLTDEEMRAKRERETEAWSAAIAAGLIVPPKAGG